MTPVEFRAYIRDPARDTNPAIVAARVMVADRDRLANEVLALKAQVADLTADAKSYQREHERLSGLLASRTRAPWEDEPGD